MAALDRDQVVAMLATFGDRTPDAVPDQISSLELTWLIAQIEQEYGVVLDFSDEVLAGMSTVSGATAVLGGALAEAHAETEPHTQQQTWTQAPHG
jgi:acyl carrier protein